MLINSKLKQNSIFHLVINNVSFTVMYCTCVSTNDGVVFLGESDKLVICVVGVELLGRCTPSASAGCTFEERRVLEEDAVETRAVKSEF